MLSNKAIAASNGMKFFLFAALVIVFIGAVLLFAFYDTLRIQILNSLFGKVATSSPANADTGASDDNLRNPAPTQWVPPGFKGPTGEPRVNGPTGPPPNY